MIIGKVPILIDDLVDDGRIILFWTLCDTWYVCLLCVYWFSFLTFHLFPPRWLNSEIVVSSSNVVTPQVACVYTTLGFPFLCALWIRVSLGDCGGKEDYFWRIFLGGQKLKLTPCGNTFSLIHPSQTFHPVFLHSHLSLARPNLEIVTVIQEPTRRSKSPPNLLWILNSGMA